MSEELANQSQEEVQEQTEVQTEEQQEMTQEEQQAFLKVKYNKEEIALDEEKAREFAQKGMNYDKVQERLQQLESDPRLSFVENMAQQYGMTPEQYIEAVQQEQEKARLDELVQKNIPEDIAKEVLESRKFREQYQTEKQQQEEQVRTQADYNAFLGKYPDINPKDIPQSVWDEVNQGESLVNAYTKYYFTNENEQLKAKLSELEGKKEVEAQNEANAEASTGALGKGDGKQTYFTKEQVEKMSREEVTKNWTAIMDSQKQWY